MPLTEWPPHGTLVIWCYDGRENLEAVVIGPESRIAEAIYEKTTTPQSKVKEYVTYDMQIKNKSCFVMVLNEHARSFKGLANPKLDQLSLAKAVLIESNENANTN